MSETSEGKFSLSINSDTHVEITGFALSSESTPTTIISGVEFNEEIMMMIERCGFRWSTYTAETSTGNSVFLDETTTERILVRTKDHS